MIELLGNYFFDAATLLDRLTSGLRSSRRQVVFVLGAPLTASRGDALGVDDVGSIIDLIRNEFRTEPENLTRLETVLHAAENQYQAAFRFLQGRRGQDVANAIVRKAVLNSHLGLRHERDAAAYWRESQLAELEDSTKDWSLSPAVSSLGELLAIPNAPFSPLVVTSNFDPLIEIAVKAAGGQSWRTSLHADGDFSQSQAAGSQVLHIHGYWHGTDTLHTGNQLLQTRPFLKSALLSYLKDKVVVVMAYGGWQDIFTGALESLVSDPSSFPEVLWTFYEQAPEINPFLRKVLQPGLDRNRVTFYGGIDCHTFFPELVERWKSAVPLDTNHRQTEPVTAPIPPIRLRPSESDRPPNIDVWVGREDEVRALETSPAKVVIICGIGGQGKSTLAAHYLKLVSEGMTSFTHWDWRDCKEQGDRIRTQLLAAIERISAQETPNEGLGTASDADIVDLFIRHSENLRCVFVLDNVDSYVDLENELFVGILDKLVREFARSASQSRIIITCRPRAFYDLISAITLPLVGLSLPETIELFDERVVKIKIDTSQVAAVHTLTNGHAFWLDMIAVQVGRAPGVTLNHVLEDIRQGKGGPTGFLNSIWKTLPERERVVLRAMAETMRPEGEEMIAAVVASKLNYKNFRKALRSLVNLNLALRKTERNSPDLFDLHPLVRQFVRATFDRPARVGFIKIILLQYDNIIKGIGAALGVHLPISMLERWSQKAELEIEAGMLADAMETLASAVNALIGGGHTEEYVRVTRKVFQRGDWITLLNLSRFEEVYQALISGLTDLEEYEDAEDLLERFEQAISAKTVQYIKYCDIKADYLWNRKRFAEAIEWATKGNDLKITSDVDTDYDCSHTLALAQRDSGYPEKALEYFTKNEDISKIIDPNEDKVTSAPLLGNVGRCLQMMGRTADALTCFRKSARLLETDGTAHRLTNQSWARLWIAEAFESQGDTEMAYTFLSHAEALIRKAFPGRAKELRARIDKLLAGGPAPVLTSLEIERRVSRWIGGSEG